jgi:hypothetical protein
MSRKRTTAMIAQDSYNLEQPPHILPVLIDLIRGEEHPNSDEQERILAHLAECVFCQDALRTLLAIELDQDRQIGITEEPIGKLISRLSSIIEKTQIREEIPAYIEAIELWGDEEAKKRHPKLAEHLQNCKSCQLLITGVQNLKREAEEAGMIAPLVAEAGG